MPEDITIAAIQSVFGEEGLDIKGYVEGVEHEDVLEGHNVGAVKALVQAARARYQMTAGLSKETRKRRLFNWLQRRGHRAEDAIKILHLLEQEQISENASQDEASM